MLDLKETAKNVEEVAARLRTRGENLDWAPFAQLVERRKALYVELEANQARRNKAAQEQRDPAVRAERTEEMRILGKTVKEQEARLDELERELSDFLLAVPNLPHASVPVGVSAEDNRCVRVWGEPPSLGFEPKQHFDIGEGLGLLDFERAAKVSGSRFAYSLGGLAKLERALVSFMVDHHVRRGYEEILPPYLVGRAAMMGTGQLPKFELDAFKTAGEHELFLIPTAEVPVTNFHADEILTPPFPKRYVAFSPCFRAEAGAAGKDTRGLIRMHQFHKVELVSFAEPENSLEELERLTADAASVLEALGLHHRVMLLCTGDMGFASQKTYDLEVWLPGQKVFREISSCSNFSDFQARRAKIRCRAKSTDKPRFVHTLNGSGLAVGRTVVALLENFQRADGTVAIPQVLQPYFGSDTLLARS